MKTFIGMGFILACADMARLWLNFNGSFLCKFCVSSTVSAFHLYVSNIISSGLKRSPIFSFISSTHSRQLWQFFEDTDADVPGFYAAGEGEAA